jgi:hypothetical protein
LFCCLSLRLDKLDGLLYNLVHSVWCEISQIVVGLSLLSYSRLSVTRDSGFPEALSLERLRTLFQFLCAKRCVVQDKHQHALPVSKVFILHVPEPELGYSLKAGAISKAIRSGVRYYKATDLANISDSP